VEGVYGGEEGEGAGGDCGWCERVDTGKLGGRWVRLTFSLAESCFSCFSCEALEAFQLGCCLFGFVVEGSYMG